MHRVRLLTRNHDASDGSRSVFNTDKSAFQVGNHFRMTLTASAGGQIGAIFIVMKGLSKDEMFGRRWHRHSGGGWPQHRRRH